MHLALIKSQQRVCLVMPGLLKPEKYTRYWSCWFCDFRNLGTSGCGVVIGANVHRMDFCLVHTIAEWSTLLKQNIWIKCLHAFEINRSKCKADVSCMFQYSYLDTGNPQDKTPRLTRNKTKLFCPNIWSEQSLNPLRWADWMIYRQFS